MSNLRKTAFQRAQELRQQKIGNTTIITPNVKDTPLKPRMRTDERYAEMMDNVYQQIENKMLDLSRWSGEGSLYKYSQLIDDDYEQVLQNEGISSIDY
jgi:hypothetical protein